MRSAKGRLLNLHPLFCGTEKTDWSLQKALNSPVFPAAIG